MGVAGFRIAMVVIDGDGEESTTAIRIVGPWIWRQRRGWMDGARSFAVGVQLVVIELWYEDKCGLLC